MVPFPWSVGLLGRFQSYRDGAMPLYAAIRFSKVRKKLYVIIDGIDGKAIALLRLRKI
jgi:Zn-dependent M32 family carboxypeptidase